MKQRMLGGVVLTAIVLGTGACSDEVGGPELEGLDVDLAVVAADGVVEDFDMFIGAIPSFRLGPLGEIGPGPVPHQRGGFGSDEITVTREVTFWDENGEEQDAFDPDLTAAIRLVLEVSEGIDRTNFSAEIERSRQMEVSGLLGQEETRIWNGTGSSDIFRTRVTRDGGERTYDIISSSTIENVVVPVPHGPDSWPLSGTITREMEVTITSGDDEGRTVTRTVVIEFDGTQFATVTVGSETFTVDLSQRPGRPGGRHGRGGHRGPGS